MNRRFVRQAIAGVICALCLAVAGAASPAGATLVHDSLVYPLRPLSLKIPAGDAVLTKAVKVRVHNVDAAPDAGGHVIQLVASEGDCPAGTIAGLPDFDSKSPGAQDSILLAAGKSAKAVVTLDLAAAAFTTVDRSAPTRCTLQFTAISPGATDPTPSNDSVPLELNVVDANDAAAPVGGEVYVKSLKPMKFTVQAGESSALKVTKPAVGNAGDLAGDLLTVTTADGTCPSGTIEVADFDSDTPGAQNTPSVDAGKSVRGELRVVVHLAEFTVAYNKVPERCIATVSVADSGGDTDPSNNTTTVVIDVYDKHDAP